MKITQDTKIWTPDLDVTLPINGKDIPKFKWWINWNGFSKKHTGFDFAAYIDEKERSVLGLPPETPVRAVADGIVKQVSAGLAETGYAMFINIEHGQEGSGLFSAYHHVFPVVKPEQYVKRGEIIANLYKDSGIEIGRLVHLHFELSNGWNIRPRKIDPASIFLGIDQIIAIPQGNKNFQIPQLRVLQQVKIANFKDIIVNE